MAANWSFRIRWMTSVGRPQGTVTLHRDLTDIHTDTFSALAVVLQIRQFLEAPRKAAVTAVTVRKDKEAPGTCDNLSRGNFGKSKKGKFII